jgi:secretion/DNA translocation related TadE-like protein
VTSRARDDRGSATVWVLALSGVLLSFGAAAVLVGTAVAARHRAEAAADLAALAAAGSAVSGTADPCVAASSIASANGAVLESCTVGPGAVVEIRVGVRVTMASLGVRWAHADARAGPVEPGS